MSKRGFRKWRNVNSIKNISYTHKIGVYQNNIELDHRSSMLNIVDSWISGYTENNIISHVTDSSNLEWRCMTCKTPITVNVQLLLKRSKRLSPDKLFCEDCKHDMPHKTDPTLIRYINSFYSYVKSKLLQNNGINNILERKEY